MAMKMELGLYQRLEQRMVLAPQMIMSMEILQLPALDLQDLIQQNLNENPVLEVMDGAAESSSPEDQAQQKADHEFEATMKRMEAVENSWRDYFEATGGARAPTGDADKDAKWEAMNNTAARSESLPEHLESQIHYAGLSEREHKVCTYLIYNIDKNGYLQYPLEDVVKTMNERGKQVALHAGGAGVARGSSPANGNGHFVLPCLGLLRDGEVRGLVLDGERRNGTELKLEVEELVERVEFVDDDDEYQEFHLQPLGLEEAEQCLGIIQTLDPPGIGARTLEECLLLQLGKGKGDPHYTLERKLVIEHLDDIRGNRFQKIAKETGETLEVIKESVAFLAGSLNPKPGALYSSEEVQYIHPDVVVDEVDGHYEVRLEDNYIPKITISSYYRDLLAQSKNDAELRDYIKKKIESAKWLMESIEQRQSTLSRISNEIVKVQQGFFDEGIESLKPLKMQDIADKVHVHVSTVCRAVADKYIQTPRGIFPLKFFFTGGTTTTDGVETSTLAVKEKIRWMVDKEDKAKPLSDDEIADKLAKDSGLEIARRTVTKYRKQLSIASSRERKEF